MSPDERQELLQRIRELEARCQESEETLAALRSGGVDAVVVSGPEGDSVYTLQGADQSYRLMVEQMAEGALTVARDGLILFANEQFAAMLNMSLDRVIGSRLQALVVPAYHKTVEAILSTRDGARAEVRLKCSGGSIPAYFSGTSLRTNSLDCIALVATDLSAQARNEEMLAQGELARSILEQAAVSILVVNPNGQIIQASRVSEQLAGMPVLLREFDAAYPLQLALEGELLTFSRILSMLRSKGSISDLQANAETPDGRTMHVIVNAAALLGKESKLLGAIVVLSDVTELKRTEEALRESESRLRTLGDNLPEGALYRFCVSPDGHARFEFISAGIERLTGVPASEIVRDGVAVDRTILPEDYARLKAALEESRAGLTRFEIEVRHKHRTTHEVHCSLIRSMPFRREDGTIVWEGVQIDITDRKRADEALRAKEEQLRQAQKMESIGVLAGGIAHDFNNLLTGVLGNASLVLDSMPQWDRNRGAIQSIMSAANRCADLTRQMLAYSGKGQFFVLPVDLSQAVREMMDLLRASIPANVEIVLDLQDNIASIQADGSQIQQIIMNLVMNASEAIGDKTGRICIRTSTRSVDAATIAQAGLDIPIGTYVCVEVQDTGPGIDEQVRPKIFEPFFTTKFQGRGLGLAAVHGIVRAHRGEILVYSHPGRGSIFTVFLPAATEGAAREVTPRVPEPYGNGTILVVDDEATVRAVAKATLERFGYRVLLAKNGVEAIDIFSQAPDQISMVLLDLTMPVMSGEETLEKLRAMRSDVPVVLSSGFNHIEVIKRFSGQGLAGFVAKPYSAAALMSQVKSVCAGSNGR